MLVPLALLLLLPGPTDPPVHVWLKGGDEFVQGDHARVQARVATDGYLVVLRADAAGRVRVLFPLDPGDDDFVRGGKTLDLAGRGGRETFAVDEADGAGVVLAAYSADPFRFDDYVRGDHWDYRVLGGASLRDDPEAGLLDIVQKMAGAEHYEYEAAHYSVAARGTYRSGYGYGAVNECFGCYGWYRPHSYFGFSLTFGSPFFYDPFYYDPFYYDPFFYGPYYDPFCWNDPFCFRGGGFALTLGGARRYSGRYVIRNGPPFVLRNDRGLGGGGGGGRPVVAPRPRTRTPESAGLPRAAGPTRRSPPPTARAAPPRSRGVSPPARSRPAAPPRRAPSGRGNTRRH